MRARDQREIVRFLRVAKRPHSGARGGEFFRRKTDFDGAIRTQVVQYRAMGHAARIALERQGVQPELRSVDLL